MEKEEFLREWNRHDSISGLRIVLVPCGEIFAQHYNIVTVTETRLETMQSKEYEKVNLYKETGGVFIDVASIKMSDIIGVI